MASLKQKEFYFIRHGQTDHNCGKIEGEHLDIPLNKKGRSQAISIEPLVTNLPLLLVWTSPLKRAKETADILLHKLSLERVETVEFSECTVAIWKKMREGERAKSIESFLQTVTIGLERVLTEKGPSLIIAHGGIYFAICKILGIPTDGIIDNCVPVRFYFDKKEHLWQIGDCT